MSANTTTDIQESRDPFANKWPGARKNMGRRPPHPSNPNQSSSRKQTKAPASGSSNPKKSSSHGALDFIDTLDTIGGFHHDGPFDAASSHRNRHMNSKNPSRQAPMAAFDPSALILPPPPPPASAPAPAPVASQDHVYPPAMPRRASDNAMPVSMGYPAGTIAADPKAARLAEAFGIQGKEAWEDFGMEHAVEQESTGGGGLLGHRRGTSREQRDAKSASVWDMEETLKSGKPVPSAYTPRSEASTRTPNGELERQATNAAQLKRSKSLMQRIKKGVKSPNLPMEMPPSPISADPNEYEELRSDPPGTSQLPSSSPIGRKASILHKFGLVKRSNTRF
ncbi:hypothetical protein, variant [Puccinia triticina 1-1 BBBD Race 1]|uniref:Pal1 cell morphology protein n=2 Tax=Puccinia triticina TaxID=208348 RepID=A0A180GGE8_PUCT1|nr:uncharacterized protein PtA15_3A812 [Puccinia triticina]OAV91548.1 hypothetical protein PTTG_01029 [Puccinia triticina 1-1 BBBD Race 1]OAV91549.1 hypothetical protein, variant [Puccinia triticina 1-1 BBBD Race 1]WAQ83441.1 hypothetical protein PtA15_3A812 [Puccinia triticina]WAR54280.1 hypothetical protein PtB15_3B794 [Puccinia triticina]